MAKLTKRQKELCIKNNYVQDKMGLLYSMWENNLLDNIEIPFELSLTERLKYIYKKYTLKDLDEMLDYKQLRVQDFCEMKEY